MHVAYLYLLRVPLLVTLLLAALGPLAAHASGTRPLLRGLFDLDNKGVFLVSFLAYFCAASATVVTDLTIRYGPRRSSVLELPSDWRKRWFRLGALTVTRVVGAALILYTTAATALVVYAVCLRDSSVWQAVLFGFVGFAAAIGFSLGIGALWKKTPVFYLSKIDRWLPNLVGIKDYDSDGRPFLLPGHGLASLMAGFYFFLYLVFAVGGWATLERIITFPVVMPTLSSVVMLLILLCWILSGLAFMLDRFRIPLLVMLSGLWIFAAQYPESDHYYSVFKESPAAEPLSPALVLRAETKTPIIVATAGGGIQAAAWTARVLTGLAERAQQAGKIDSFARSIRLISSVSGGSVGALYFLAAYNSGTLTSDSKLLQQQVLDRSWTSSLDPIAWGLIYPDMTRSVLPFRFLSKYDRGWAAEQAWTRHGEISAGLKQWREDARHGRRPAVVFNSTIAETGERLMLSSYDPAKPARGRRTFRELYPTYDLSPVTAARLSATFPYVSPAARIREWVPKSHRFHVVDGGYYDNYGISSIAEALDEATSAERNFSRVLLIHIAGPPAPEPGKAPTEHQTQRGWFYQTFAPISTMLGVWQAGQRSHNQIELNLLTQVLRQRGVTLEQARFFFPKDDTPLSWHLTEAEKREVTGAWNKCGTPQTAGTCELGKVLQFLGIASEQPGFQSVSSAESTVGDTR